MWLDAYGLKGEEQYPLGGSKYRDAQILYHDGSNSKGIWNNGIWMPEGKSKRYRLTHVAQMPEQMAQMS